MPLPKPPAKKAALLAPADFDAPAAPERQRSVSLKPAASAEARRRRRRWTCSTAARTPAGGGAAAPSQRRPRPTVRRPPGSRRTATCRASRASGPAKLFVLDTNVLMHDPMCLFRFDEHDIFLPMITLEELDGHKKGMSEVARNARQVSRDLDALALPAAPARARQRSGHRAGEDRPPRGRRQAVLPDHAARRQAARRAAAGQGRQPDPRRRAGACASSTPAARGGAGVQGHQHARQGARAGPGGRGLLQRQDARRRRPALHRRAAAAGRLLGAPRQDDGELAAGRPHLLPHQRPAGAGAADQPVRLPRGAGRGAAVRPRHRDHRQDRGAEDAARLHATRRTPSGA